MLYVDGELPLNLLQERIRLLHKVHKHLPIISTCWPVMSSRRGFLPQYTGGQEFGKQALQPDTKLIVLDNISTLVRNGLENESRSWQPIQDWTLEMRLRGYSILLIHHTGSLEISVGLQVGSILPMVIKLTPLEAEEGTTCMLLTYIKPLRHARRANRLSNAN